MISLLNPFKIYYMKKHVYYLVILLISLSNMEAQTATNQKNVPILDRELFFGNPEIAAGQLSPDGKWISFMKANNGILNIWIKKFDEPFEKARPLTDSKRPMQGYFWTYDGKYILYIKDENGDENVNVFAVDPMAKAAANSVPPSRNLTPLKEITAQIQSVSIINPDLMMVSLNDRDKAWHDLYQLKISTGELTKIYENKDRVTGYVFDWDDNLRILSKTDEKGTSSFFKKEGEKLIPIYETSVTEEAYIPSWTPDNKQAYFVTNKGDLNLSTLFLMDMDTQKMKKIESDPKNRVDFGSLNVSELTREVISTSYTDDKTEYQWKNKKWESDYKFLQSKFPGREISFNSRTNDEKKFLISVSGDKYAPEMYFF